MIIPKYNIESKRMILSKVVQTKTQILYYKVDVKNIDFKKNQLNTNKSSCGKKTYNLNMYRSAHATI